ALVLSIAAHLSLILIALIVSWIHPQAFKINTQVYHVSLVSLPAKKSDSAAPGKPTFNPNLPRATIEQMKKAEPEDNKKEMTIPDQKAAKKKEEPTDVKKLDKEIARIKKEVELDRKVAAIAKHAEETRQGDVKGVDNSVGTTGGTEAGVTSG